MNRSLVIAISFLFLCSSAVAQSVVVTPRKVLYRRPDPIVDYKRTFTVTYPRVRAATPALSRKIENAISYRNVLQLDVREEINEVQWLEEASYKVDYKARGLLCITLTMSGSGAYPDGSSKTVVIDTKMGRRINARDAFADVDRLVDRIKQKQALEITNAIDEIRKDPDLGESDPAELFADKAFALDDLDHYAIDAKGVTFIYDYGFPHVIRAVEPEGRYTFTWSEMSRFVDRSGPFAHFISKH